MGIPRSLACPDSNVVCPTFFFIESIFVSGAMAVPYPRQLLFSWKIGSISIARLGLLQVSFGQVGRKSGNANAQPCRLFWSRWRFDQAKERGILGSCILESGLARLARRYLRWAGGAFDEGDALPMLPCDRAKSSGKRRRHGEQRASIICIFIYEQPPSFPFNCFLLLQPSCAR
jgi:hypothetical protein